MTFSNLIILVLFGGEGFLLADSSEYINTDSKVIEHLDSYYF